jgi:hypothetical protein
MAKAPTTKTPADKPEKSDKDKKREGIAAENKKLEAAAAKAEKEAEAAAAKEQEAAEKAANEVDKEAQTNASLHKRVSYLERTLKKHLGSVFKDAGSIRVCMLIALFVLSLAAGSFAAEKKLISWKAGEGSGGFIEVEADQGDDANDTLRLGIGSGTNKFYVHIGGTEVFSVDSSGDIVSSGISRDTVTALAPTNEQHLTVSESSYLVTTPGSATNGLSITLAAPTTAGDRVRFVMASSATFTQQLDIADSGNVALSAAFVGTADDALTLFAPTTSLWVEESRSSN